MKWNIKIKKEKVLPRIGDVKTEVKYAFFPVKVENKYVWFEKYIRISEYKKEVFIQTYDVSSGLLEDAFTTTGLLNTRTVTKTRTAEVWIVIDRKLIQK